MANWLQSCAGKKLTIREANKIKAPDFYFVKQSYTQHKAILANNYSNSFYTHIMMNIFIVLHAVTEKLKECMGNDCC